jgi:hypothetical protein
MTLFPKMLPVPRFPGATSKHDRFNPAGFNHGLKAGQCLTKIFKEFDGKFRVTRASPQEFTGRAHALAAHLRNPHFSMLCRL